MPVAAVSLGLWACGDDAASSAECLTSNCGAQAGLSSEVADFGLSSSATVPDGVSSPSAGDVPMSVATMSSPSGAEGPDIVVLDSLSSAAGPVAGSSDSAPLSSPALSSAGPVVASSATVQATSSSAVTIPPVASSSSVVTPASSESTPQPVANAFVEDHRSECQIGDIPKSVNNSKLPDPFKKLDGTRISSKADWKCRREEIGATLEKLMLGEKPRKPEKVEGSFSGGKLTIKVTDKGKSGSFSVTIKNGGTKDKPKPALIGFGGGSLGKATDGLDIAIISFNPDDVAPEKGGGMFFNIYGGNTDQYGTIIAWAWGVSRVIDALEKTPDAGIDVKHLAMTGCSRWGKGTLVVGAFDERIALTIPQESGSGGASLWRVGAQVNKQKGKQFVQGLNSAGSEGKWMISSFKSYDGKENTLPFDQHMLVDMVAPRALLIIDNAGQEWLGEVPSNYCGQASKEVYDALGMADNYTYSQEGGHGHCQLPSGQYDEVKDFINKFLFEKDVKTGKIDYTKNSEKIDWKKSDWIDWDTPTLN